MKKKKLFNIGKLDLVYVDVLKKTYVLQGFQETYLSKGDYTFHKDKTYHPRSYECGFLISMSPSPLETLEQERK